jgi:hypothetical protein
LPHGVTYKFRDSFLPLSLLTLAFLPPPSSDTHPPIFLTTYTSSCLTSMTPSSFVFSHPWPGRNGVNPDSQRSPYLQPGDIVAVNSGLGRREGLVVGSHIDHLVRDALLLCAFFFSRLTCGLCPQGRQIIEVQLDTQVVNYW